MAQPMHSARISAVNFEDGFVGDGKVFIHVEKQADDSEKLVIYEAKNSVTGFFLNLFRDRQKTFTAREWAARIQKKLPKEIDKAKLIQNIKQAASTININSAPLILNRLVNAQQLDASEEVVSKSIQDIPLDEQACAAKIEASLKQLQKKFQNSLGGKIFDLHQLVTKDLKLESVQQDLFYVLTYLQFSKSNSNFGERSITRALLSNLDNSAVNIPWEKSELKAFVKMLIVLESQSKTENASLDQIRYRNTLRHIDEYLQKQDAQAAVPNPL